MTNQETILILGLGNPGEKFIQTRHNFGFFVLNSLLKALEETGNQKLGFKTEKKFKSEICRLNYPKNQKIILAKPLTFVNLSGEAAIALKKFFKPHKIIVVYDDLNLPLKTIRLKFAGQSGGHKGVKNIIEKIGSDFWRLKLGIGPQPFKMRAEKFVLQKIDPKEKKTFEQIAQKAASLLLKILKGEEKLAPITINYSKE